MRPLLYYGWRWLVAHRREMFIVGAMVGAVVAITALSSQPSHGQTIANALQQVNARRASLGLYALAPDPRLQAAAEYDAAWRAQRGVSGHLASTPMVGRAEGVGWQSGYDPWGREFHTCFHTASRGKPGYTRSHRYAGAAVATRGGRTFYTLILR